MSGSRGVRLPDHVVLRELPFCGVLLDTRTSRVYRLSRPAAELLRQTLTGPGGNGEVGVAGERLLGRLSELGLIQDAG